MADADKELLEAQQLSTAIFKEGALVNVTIGFWEGKIHQDQKDVEATNATLDAEVYTPGFKWLIPQKYTKQFGRFRSRLNSVMDRMSYRVPGMRGSRFVPKGAYPQIKAFLEGERTKFFEERDRFLEAYPGLAEAQKQKFDAAYPRHAGAMDRLYPEAEYLRGRFSYSWTPYSWAHTEIAEVAEDAKRELAERSKQLVYQSALQIRQHIIEATQSVVNAIKNGKNTVNVRAVSAFTQRLEQLQNLNLFADKEIDYVLRGASAQMRSISSWDKAEVDKTGLQDSLESLVEGLQEDVREIERNPDAFVVTRREITV